MAARRIEIEGIDGAGKTTGMAFLVSSLRELGFKVLETREVGNKNIETCIKLREIALSEAMNSTEEGRECLMGAMRLLNDIYYQKVESEYDFIISDRGWFSHLAYGEANINQEFITDFFVNFMAPRTNTANMVVYFSADPEICAKRMNKRGEAVDAIEQKGLEFQIEVADNFQKYFEYFDPPLFVIDANKEIKEVEMQLLNFIKSILDI